MANFMNRSPEKARYFCSAFCLMSVIASAQILRAQESSCNDLVVQDTLMPAYAPIARAAHIQGIVSFDIHLDASGKATTKLSDGLPFLAGAAESYISGRRHYWATGGEHKPCSYVAKVEYRIIQPESDSTNNFHRVTVLGPGYTLVETQNQKPSCMDCVSDECSMDEVSESKQPTYPPIARAARISGEVSARIEFDKKGFPTGIDQYAGPPMLKAATEEYLRSWKIKPLQYIDSCHATVLIEYRLTAATEVIESDVKVFKADPTHILIEDHSVLTMDPATTITKKKHS
jgi:hypothetical protein